VRIGIDVRKIKDGGIGTYISELLERIIPADSSNEYTLFFAPEDISEYDYSWHNVVKKINRSGKYSLGEHVSFPIQAQKEKLDLFFFPHYTKSWWMPCPSVTTVHDLIHLRFPEYLPNPLARHYAKLIIGRACRSSEVVIADSEATKRDLLGLFSVEERKIKVVYIGVDHQVYLPLQEEEKLTAFREKYSLFKPFILYVGALKPHKNLPVLLRGYSLSRLRGRFDLLIATLLAGDTGRIDRFVTELQVQDNVRYLFSLSKAELALLYNCAHFLVLPSLYEGFGLPALEAMACGCPVIVSNRASLPEVVGEAGLLFDPTSPEELAERMSLLAADSELYHKLKEEGRIQAQKFRWEGAAEKILRVFREVAD
jgi:glycosyltransferase involved in cell wall biosynthesis